MPDSTIKLDNIRISFGSVQVLRGVTLKVRPQEIVAVLGANGAGKSTLMNILSGKLPSYQGQIHWLGEPVRFNSPHAAMARGIEMVQQELGLIPDLTGMENIMLGHEPSRLGIIDRAACFRAAHAATEQIARDVPLDLPVRTLSPSRQQLIALSRALRRKPKLLILDEPTSMITDADVELLISVLKALKAQGVAIVFISHKFNEVFALADRAVILRDGVVVGEAQTAKLNHDQIVTWMVGTPPAAYLATTEEKAHHPSKNSRVLLAAKKLRSLHAPPFSLAVHEGEVVGLIGLVGSGRSEILRVLAGIDAIKGGELMVAGQVVCKHNVKEMMKRGVLLLPEDRKMQGLFLDQSLGFNALIYNLDAYSRFGFVMFGAENQAFDDAQKLNRADVNSGWRVARTLSGGNQQRLMLGKTLLRGGKVLLLDELSAGVDVTTKIDSLRRVQEFAHQGMGILFTSSQWEEVTDIADRLYVVANGNIVGEFAKGQASHADFMHLIIENTSESSKQGNCR